MSRSYAMTLPPLSPDASGPICHLGAYYLYPPCDAPAQMLLWTSQLYAKREVRSIGDMPHGAQAGVLMPIAVASAWFSAASLSGDKVSMKEVSADLGILMSTSQCMLLACCRPSSTPTGPCVKGHRRKNTLAHRWPWKNASLAEFAGSRPRKCEA